MPVRSVTKKNACDITTRSASYKHRLASMGSCRIDSLGFVLNGTPRLSMISRTVTARYSFWIFHKFALLPHKCLTPIWGGEIVNQYLDIVVIEQLALVPNTSFCVFFTHISNPTNNAPIIVLSARATFLDRLPVSMVETFEHFLSYFTLACCHFFGV